jgi:Leucine Rich repeat
LRLYLCQLRDEGIRLLADALVGNTTIEILDIGNNGITFNGLDDITRLLEPMRLHTISLEGNMYVFGMEASTQRFTRVLSRHDFLKELNLRYCGLCDGGICKTADALVGNGVTEFLDIGYNYITPVGLADITRLRVSTRLKSVLIWGNPRVFRDADAVQHFVSTLQHKKVKCTTQKVKCTRAPDDRLARPPSPSTTAQRLSPASTTA